MDDICDLISSLDLLYFWGADCSHEAAERRTKRYGIADIGLGRARLQSLTCRRLTGGVDWLPLLGAIWPNSTVDLGAPARPLVCVSVAPLPRCL